MPCTLRQNSSGAYYCALAYFDAWQYNGTCTYAASFLKDRRLLFVVWIIDDRVSIVHGDSAWPDKNVIFDDHVIRDVRLILDPYAISKFSLFPDIDEGPDDAIISDLGAFTNHGEGPDRDVITKFNARVDVSLYPFQVEAAR